MNVNIRAIPRDRSFGNLRNDSASLGTVSRTVSAASCAFHTLSVNDMFAYTPPSTITTTATIGPANFSVSSGNPFDGYWSTRNRIMATADNATLFQYPFGIASVVLHIQTKGTAGIFGLIPILQSYDPAANEWADIPGAIIANSGSTNTEGRSVFVGYKLDTPLSVGEAFRIRLHADGLENVSIGVNEKYRITVYANIFVL